MDTPFHAEWKAASASMELFAFRLAAIMDRPVIDQTGLNGEYDFTLTYTMDWPPNLPPDAMVNGQPIDTSGPSIFQAVRQQLGLRLDARKGPVQMIAPKKAPHSLRFAAMCYTPSKRVEDRHGYAETRY